MDSGRDLFQRAVAAHQGGELTQAEELYRQVLQSSPQHADAMVNLAAIVYNRDPQGSLDLLRQARKLKPEDPGVHFNLGNLLQRHGYREKAINEFQLVLKYQPNHPEAYFRLGTLLAEANKLDEAIYCYQKSFELNPKDVRVVNNLTEIYNRQKRYEEAESMARKTLELAPDLAEAHGNLGVIYKGQGNYKKAEFHLLEALKKQPDNARMLNHLGATLLFSNRAEEATTYLKRAIEADPDFHEAHSGYVYALNYFEASTREEIFEAHRAWGARHGKGIRDDSWAWIDRNPQKKLKVGFVSPDFKAHVVALFIQQLFKHYDRKQFEFFGYAEVTNPDGYTNKFMSLLDGWRSIVGVSDVEVYDTIKADGIDILVDLAGHTTGNRLPVFALKPAPVQVSYLGYINTTGLDTIDYRITDRYVDPPGAEEFYTEELIRMEHSFTCYEPIDPCPKVSEAPVLKNGYITFGCFNNSNKIGPGLIRTWSQILQQVPGSRLLLKSTNFDDSDTKQRFLGMFEVHGVGADRVAFEGSSEIYSYLEAYSRIDIALDPFPHNGGTTSHDCLWMGVPMVALAGDRYVSRFGVSILNNLGHPEWIANNREEYVSVARTLAVDVERLSQLRKGLRKEMQSSPLCDDRHFADQFGGVLKDIWEQYCRP